MSITLDDPGVLEFPPLKGCLSAVFFITSLSCVPDRVTRGLLERREIQDDQGPQDLLAPGEEM